MTYKNYLSRKILKNKFNFIPLVILILAVLICLAFNVRNKAANSYLIDTKNDIRQGKQALHDSQSDLKRKNESAAARKIDKTNIADEKRDIKTNQLILNRVHGRQWRAAYKQKIILIKQDLKVSLNSKGSGTGLIKAMKRDLLIYQDLAKKNLEKQDDDFPTQGIGYSVWVSKTILPYLLVLSIIFVLVQIYGDAFEGKLNKNNLLPISKKTVISENITSGSIFSIGTLIITELIALMAGWTVSGVGALNYPYLSYAVGSGKMELKNISDLILPSLLLQCLAIVFIIELTYFIVTLVRNRLASLFITLLLTIGVVLMTSVVEPIQRIAQFLPTTYVNGISVVSGQYGQSIANYHLSFSTGLLTLIPSIMIFYLLIVFVNTKLLKF
ncbi:hypothetical protein ABUE38_10260 [Pediococcus parvulus]|uniref:Uncharacterized protein n=1 Tax=Pediococcus parvulus TaxID=54062 RepID=A0AAP5T9Y8_9LACO|nr:hypothetical protein [Pediococcus parvulus]MDV7693610.1 hypothetical protein [Pediococcus parvulus]OAD63733.1 hypothetical protein A7K95_08540 [Pediococcus parvulus]